MADLMELAERVEALSGPDRDVDVQIAAYLCGGKVDVARLYWTSPGFRGFSVVPSYTASLDAARALVPEGYVVCSISETPEIVKEEHTGDTPLPNWEVALLRQDCAGYRNRNKFMQAFKRGCGTMASLALCAAALRARASNG